jgi:hypothetical protein
LNLQVRPRDRVRQEGSRQIEEVGEDAGVPAPELPIPAGSGNLRFRSEIGHGHFGKGVGALSNGGSLGCMTNCGQVSRGWSMTSGWEC